MMFLSWDSLKDAEDSLAAIDAMYGCPYVAENGYRMDSWAEIMRPIIDGYYGFSKPEVRLGSELSDLMAVLVPGFTEKPYNSEDFHTDEDLA